MVSTIPQLISPTNSEPSRRNPHAVAGEPQRVLGGEVELHVAGVAPAQPLRPQRLHRLSKKLLSGVAEQLLGERVHEYDPPVTRRCDNGVGQSLQHRRRREQQSIDRLVFVRAPPPVLRVPCRP